MLILKVSCRMTTKKRMFFCLASVKRYENMFLYTVYGRNSYEKLFLYAVYTKSCNNCKF